MSLHYDAEAALIVERNAIDKGLGVASVERDRLVRELAAVDDEIATERKKRNAIQNSIDTLRKLDDGKE